MKANAIVPTVQFGNMTFELEGSAEEIIDETRRLLTLWQGAEGLEEKKFQKIFDSFLWEEGSIHPDDYAQMSKEQQNIIQYCKRSKNRFEYKLNHP